ncbi:MAG: hypothetical protein CMN72_07070 [Sphingomonas sp.]|nr:hypothetical protein [Sphingomonas sp.]
MERRNFLTSTVGAGMLAASPRTAAASSQTAVSLPAGGEDRLYMLDLLVRMANPVLRPMAEGKLQARWNPAVSPTWDGRDVKVGYLEAFGRLMSGIAPWLALPDSPDAEGKIRSALRDMALACFAHSVDPTSPDYLLWRSEGQPLVDSAFYTQALLRAPKQLWKPLSSTTKRQIVTEIKGLRRVDPPYSNWLLFAAMNEVFLLSVGEDWDPLRVDIAIRKINEWYVGDGWYADGNRFHYDYYGSYVIHPMLTQVLDVLADAKIRIAGDSAEQLRETAYRRMQRYAGHLERMIGPEGAYPPIGRSLTYRTAVFQPLGLLAWRKQLPETLAEGRVRAATLAAQRAVFSNPTNFDEDGYLTIGFAGKQPTLGDVYSNAGSMYIVAESLIALGLAATDTYWTAPPISWTSRNAFSGQKFLKDYPVDY